MSFRAILTTGVSIHTPARGATLCGQVRRQTLPVSIHTPARGATNTTSSQRFSSRFQFTRPQGARQCLILLPMSPARFNSHARKGRDLLNSAKAAVLLQVSIHTPARGATPVARSMIFTGRFQFTRPQGARPHPVVITPRIGAVSIHTPARGATLHEDGTQTDEAVSIHTPARGATARLRKRTCVFLRFNSHAREGRDARQASDWP